MLISETPLNDAATIIASQPSVRWRGWSVCDALQPRAGGAPPFGFMSQLIPLLLLLPLPPSQGNLQCLQVDHDGLGARMKAHRNISAGAHLDHAGAASCVVPGRGAQRAR